MGFLNLEGLRYLTAQLKTLFATKTYVDEKFENSGTVKSVANIGPDGTGNVALTAENIQAIPNTAAVVSYLEDGTPGDAIPLNADTLGGRPAEDFALSENGLPTVEASKSGTVFQIDSVEAQQFILVPDADYVDGDTFTIAGRSVEAKLPNGTSLPGNFFIAGAKIICLLNNNTLYFAAGGGAGGGGAGTAKLCIYKAVFTQEGWTLKTDEGTSESWYEQTVALEAYNTNKSATPNTVLLTPMFIKGESEEENSANAELASFKNDNGQVSVGDATVTVKAVLSSAPNVSGTVYWASTDVVGIAGGGSVPDNVMLYRMDDDTPGQPPTPINADTLQGHNAEYFEEMAIHTYTCVTSGTNHALTGTGNNIKFVADSDFAEGDTISVNGTAVTAQTQGGETLGDGAWVAGAVVVCYLEGRTLNFNEGAFGAVKSGQIIFASALNSMNANTYTNYDSPYFLNGICKKSCNVHFFAAIAYQAQNEKAFTFSVTVNGEVKLSTNGPDGGAANINRDMGTLEINKGDVVSASFPIGAGGANQRGGAIIGILD